MWMTVLAIATSYILYRTYMVKNRSELARLSRKIAADHQFYKKFKLHHLGAQLHAQRSMTPTMWM